MPTTQTRKIKCDAPLSRSFALNREAVNEEKRTIELSFSSETRDVERWFGIEILDHKSASVRLERMRANGPLLFNHDWDKHLGAVTDVRIVSRRGKAVVRFGNSPLAEEKFRDALDGILTAVSFQYRVYKMVLEERSEDGNAPDVYRAVDWEPIEISLVTVPADISVGVGRAAGESFEIEVEEAIMPEVNTNNGGADNNRSANTTTAPAAPTFDRVAVENEVRAAEQKRTSDLLSMGDRYSQYGARELAQQYIKEGKTPADLQRAILDRLPTTEQVGTRGEAPGDTRLDLSMSDLRNYSLIRAINAVVAARQGDHKAMEAAAFEMECSRELGDRLGREARGFFVPLDVVTRAMTASANSDLIANQHMGDMFIDTLRPKSVVMQLGATVMDGLDGNLELPKALTDPAFNWIGDDDDAGLTNVDTGMIKMAPKTLAGGVPMSRRLLKQSSPSVERVVHNALLKGAALGIDYGILAGTGTNNQPLGVINMAGINTQSVAAAGAPTWPELVAFETKVAADNALEGKLAYVTTSGVRGSLKTTPKDAGSGRFLLDGDNANGYPVAVSNQLAANRIVFGNWEDVYVGFWGVIDVNPDLATKAGSGGLVLRVFQDADVGIGHAESFCINS